MKPVKLLVIALLFCNSIKSQDTIYSDAYPKGLLAHEYTQEELTEKRVYAKKDGFTIGIPVNEIIKIVNKEGSVKYENKQYEKSNKFVAETDAETGKIAYTEVVEAKGATKKQLYDALIGLPSTDVYYGVLSKDDNDYSAITYRAYTYVKISGDLHTLYCNLAIKIKDDKIKFEMSDYRLFYSEQKGVNVMGNANYSTGATHIKNIPLEKSYTPANRDKGDRIWEAYSKLFNSTVNSIKSKVSKSKTDW
jgi:hypothetical protein